MTQPSVGIEQAYSVTPEDAMTLSLMYLELERLEQEKKDSADEYTEKIKAHKKRMREMAMKVKGGQLSISFKN